MQGRVLVEMSPLNKTAMTNLGQAILAWIEILKSLPNKEESNAATH